MQPVSLSNMNTDEELGGGKPEVKPPLGSVVLGSGVVFAGLCYAFASGSMILMNKYALDPKSFGFSAPTVLLLFQCLLSVLLVKMYEWSGKTKLQPLSYSLVRVWFPVNLLFVCMIGTSFYALQSVGVAMVTVWKNVANFVTAIGDVTIYKKTFSLQVWLCLVLMLCSALVGASTDYAFTWGGYGWQVANCGFTSAYALYLRSVMDKTAEHTTTKQKMDELSMVYYNNLLSIPPILLLVFIFGEHRGLLSLPALSNPNFLATAVLGGFLGFSISFCSLWFLSQTSATTYSLVGALNKIPVAVVGIVVFREVTNVKNLGSIVLGLGAGVMFVYAKTC